MRLLLVVVLLALVCRWGVAQVGPRYVIELPGGAAMASAQGHVQLAGKGLVLIRFQGLSILTVDAEADAYSAEAVQGWPAADLLMLLPPGAGRYDGVAPLRGLRDGVPVVVAEAAGRDAEDVVGVAAGAGAATVGATAAAAASSDAPRPAGPTLYPLQPWNTLDLRKHGTRLRVTAMPGAPGTLAVAGYLLEMGNNRSSYRLYAGGADDEAAVLAQRLPGADVALLPGRAGPHLLALNRGAPAKTGPAALTAAGYAFTALKR